MLLKKENGRRLSAVSLCLAMTFAPLFTASAGEPELVPSDGTATPAEQSPVLLHPGAQSPAMASLVGTQPLADGSAANSRADILATLPSGYQPVYLNPLATLYAAREMKPMWENRDAIRAFQQQLAEVAIAGFQP